MYGYGALASIFSAVDAPPPCLNGAPPVQAQLGAAVERLGEFGVSLSKAAQGLGEPEAGGPLGSPLWEACAAAEEGGGEGGGSQRSGSGQPGGGSSCSEGEGEGAAQGEDILDAGEETEAAEVCGAGLLSRAPHAPAVVTSAGHGCA